MSTETVAFRINSERAEKLRLLIHNTGKSKSDIGKEALDGFLDQKTLTLVMTRAIHLSWIEKVLGKADDLVNALRDLRSRITVPLSPCQNDPERDIIVQQTRESTKCALSDLKTFREQLAEFHLMCTSLKPQDLRAVLRIVKAHVDTIPAENKRLDEAKSRNSSEECVKIELKLELLQSAKRFLELFDRQ